MSIYEYITHMKLDSSANFFNYVQRKGHFLASAFLALLFWCSAAQYTVSKAENANKDKQILLAQSIAQSSRFRNYWDRFTIYPGRLQPDRALLIADGGFLEFESRIQCPSGVDVFIHTPTEPQVVLDVSETTSVHIESTNFTRGLVVVVADENFNILSCNNSAVPGVQINRLTLRTGTYGVWYGVKAGYQSSRVLDSKLWILNE